ncbi:hypothetical protein [Parafilimonas terrae]|uniref:hypothetical protein n=1 Tax=Parafilimonas terrae TaxID=1465490 RepID=UPI000B80395F|nr:hypothetical protein [Parafilimonas terrae]
MTNNYKITAIIQKACKQEGIIKKDVSGTCPHRIRFQQYALKILIGFQQCFFLTFIRKAKSNPDHQYPLLQVAFHLPQAMIH